MEDSGAAAQPPQHRDSIKSSVVNTSASRRRQHATALGKGRREALIRTKRLCRNPVADIDDSVDADMIFDEDKSVLEAQIPHIVESLNSALSQQGKGAEQNTVEILCALRRLLSRSETPPIEAALKAGAVPALAQCLAFGSPDEQLLEAAWCLTNIAAGELEDADALLPVLPLLIAHLGDKSYSPVAEQCAWALGNIAGEGVHLRNILLAQGALIPLARLMMGNKGSTARTAAWTLSNLIKGPDSKAATELIKIDGMLDAITGHLRAADDELATEIAWVVVYLSALSTTAVNLIVKTDIGQLLVERLAASESLQLLIPVLRSLGNLVAADSYMTNKVFTVGHPVTDQAILALNKCLKSEHRVLKKEAAWALSNIAAGSIEHKILIFSSEAGSLLAHLLLHEAFDIKREAAYALGNLCVAPAERGSQPNIITDHLVAFVRNGCLPGFISLVRSADIEAARLGLQFLEVVMRGMPNNEGPKLVEQEDGIDAMERFQFHENEEMRNMANGLVDKYFGEDYGLDD